MELLVRKESTAGGSVDDDNRIRSATDPNEIEMSWIVPTATSTHDSSSKKESTKRSSKQQPSMLTSGQLSDLFRRLDTSGIHLHSYELLILILILILTLILILILILIILTTTKVIVN